MALQGFKVSSLEFRTQRLRLGFRVWILEFGTQDLGFRVWDVVVQGLGRRVRGEAFRAWGLWFEVRRLLGSSAVVFRTDICIPRASGLGSLVIQRCS